MHPNSKPALSQTQHRKVPFMPDPRSSNRNTAHPWNLHGKVVYQIGQHISLQVILSNAQVVFHGWAP